MRDRVDSVAAGHAAVDGARAGDALRPGSVFAAYLILTGVARFLVEFIRINPRSFFGMSNAQAASVVSVIAGAALWWHVARKALARPQVS